MVRIPAPPNFRPSRSATCAGLDFYAAHKLGDFYERKRRATLNTSDPRPDFFSQHSDDQFVEAYSGFVGMYERSNHLANLTRSDLIANIDLDLLRKNVVSLEEFFVSCQHTGKDCSEAGTLTEIDHPHYFRCFTYTPSGDKIRSGVANGWSAIVNTGSGMLESPADEIGYRIIPGLYEKGSSVEGGGGVRVVVHRAGTLPTPVNRGFDVPAGFSVSLAFRPRQNIRIGPPHGDCIPGQSVFRRHRAHERHSLPPDRLPEDV